MSLICSEEQQSYSDFYHNQIKLQPILIKTQTLHLIWRYKLGGHEGGRRD